MNKMSRERLKILIELSTTVEEADEVIRESIGFESVKEKIAFLKGMFDCEVIDRQTTDSDELIYSLLLNGIISKN